MSTLLDLQNEIAVLINASEYLVQGGCEAFAEDKADTLTRLEIALWDRGRSGDYGDDAGWQGAGE